MLAVMLCECKTIFSWGAFLVFRVHLLLPRFSIDLRVLFLVDSFLQGPAGVIAAPIASSATVRMQSSEHSAGEVLRVQVPGGSLLRSHSDRRKFRSLPRLEVSPAV